MSRIARSALVLVFVCACNNDSEPQVTSFGGAMTEANETGAGSSSSAAGSSSGAAGESSEGSAGMSESSASGSTSGASSGGVDETGAAESSTTGPDCTPGYQGCECLAENKCANGLECDPMNQVCVPIGSLCGDAIKGGMEECDDGINNGDDKKCKTDCTLNVCGDGAVGPGEVCDDGNTVDDDECSNMCKPPVCGNKVTEAGEDCDDGNMIKTDACIDCKAAVCGDSFIQAGVENCDDGNNVDMDGCSALCKVELGECGGKFSTGWCPQIGTTEQYTRCENVTNNNKTCNNPLIKYGSVENGVPAQHGGNDYNTWCVQLGFAGFSGQVTYGNRACDAPQGRLFGCTGYDENVWHWCDWQDGPWLNQQLDHHQCNDGQEVTSVTCL